MKNQNSSQAGFDSSLYESTNVTQQVRLDGLIQTLSYQTTDQSKTMVNQIQSDAQESAPAVLKDNYPRKLTSEFIMHELQGDKEDSKNATLNPRSQGSVDEFSHSHFKNFIMNPNTHQTEQTEKTLMNYSQTLNKTNNGPFKLTSNFGQSLLNDSGKNPLTLKDFNPPNDKSNHLSDILSFSNNNASPINGAIGQQNHFFSSKRSPQIDYNSNFYSSKEGNQFNQYVQKFYSSSNENKENQVNNQKQEEFGALVYVGGSNASGQLGLGERMSGQSFTTMTPLQNTFNSIPTSIAKVSCGQRHAAIVTQSRQLFMMGSNRQGQLGIGLPGDSSHTLTQCSFPMLVDSLAQSQVVDVTCGKDHTLAIVTTQPFKSKNKYSVYSWGSNSHGQLGLKTQKVHVPVPEVVQFTKRTTNGKDDFTGIIEVQPEIGRISAGTHHSLFLDSTTGIVYGSGSNSHGQLGKTSMSGMDGVPMKLNIEEIQNEPKQKIVQIACGYRHSLLLSFSGKVFESGEVPEGFISQSGRAVYDPPPENDMDGTNVRDAFKQVPGLRSVLKISAGSHSAAIDCKGYLYIWGTPQQMSFGNFPRPFRISQNKSFADEIVSMRVGNDFGIAKDRAGKVLSWGKSVINNGDKLDDISANYESTDGRSHHEKSFFEDILKQVCIKDQALNWELKADQLGAGYDSVFVSVMPKGTSIEDKDTMNQTHLSSIIRIDTQPGDDYSVVSPNPTPSHHNHDNKTLHTLSIKEETGKISLGSQGRSMSPHREAQMMTAPGIQVYQENIYEENEVSVKQVQDASTQVIIGTTLPPADTSELKATSLKHSMEQVPYQSRFAQKNFINSNENETAQKDKLSTGMDTQGDNCRSAEGALTAQFLSLNQKTLQSMSEVKDAVTSQRAMGKDCQTQTDVDSPVEKGLNSRKTMSQEPATATTKFAFSRGQGSMESNIQSSGVNFRGASNGSRNQSPLRLVQKNGIHQRSSPMQFRDQAEQADMVQNWNPYSQPHHGHRTQGFGSGALQHHILYHPEEQTQVMSVQTNDILTNDAPTSSAVTFTKQNLNSTSTLAAQNTYHAMSHEHQNVPYPFQLQQQQQQQQVESNNKTASQNCQIIHKLKKKYKRLKNQTRVILMENDRLKQQIMELPSALSHQHSQAFSEQEQQVISWRHRAETAEQLVVAQKEEFERQRSTDAIYAQVTAMESSVGMLRQQLSNAAGENVKSQQEILNLTDFIQDRNQHISELKSNLNLRAENEIKSEQSVKVLSQTMEDLYEKYEQAAQEIADKDANIEYLRKQMAAQTEQYEQREAQVQNLLVYISQLESSNQEMVHQIDLKNYNLAQNYKEKVLDLLHPAAKNGNTYTSSQRAQEVKSVDADRGARRSSVPNAVIPSKRRAISPDGQAADISSFPHSPAAPRRHQPVEHLHALPLSPRSSDLPSDIRLRNLKEQEKSDNASLVNSLMQNLPGMLDDADFKFKKRRTLPRTIGSPEYALLPSNYTPINGQYSGQANDIMQKLAQINDGRSASHSDVSVKTCGGSNNYAMELSELNPGQKTYNGLRRKRIPKEKSRFNGMTCLQHSSQPPPLRKRQSSENDGRVQKQEVKKSKNSYSNIANYVTRNQRFQHEHNTTGAQKPLRVPSKLGKVQSEERQTVNCATSLSVTHQHECSLDMPRQIQNQTTQLVKTSSSPYNSRFQQPSYDTIQDVLKKGRRLLGGEDYPDSPLRKQQKSTQVYQKETKEEMISPRFVSVSQIPEVKPSEVYYEEEDSPREGEGGVSISTKITRTMMQKGLQKVNEVLVQMKRDRQVIDNEMNQIGDMSGYFEHDSYYH